MGDPPIPLGGRARTVERMPNDASPTDDTAHETATPPAAEVSRRGMMGTLFAAAAGAGAAAILGDSTPAAATTSTMYTGVANFAGTDETSLSANLAGAALAIINPSGYGIAGESTTLYGGYGAEYGVNLSAGNVGVQADGGVAGVYGKSTNGTGVAAFGGRADLVLYGAGLPPNERVDAHSRGEMLRDANGATWVCVQNGSPGSWRKLAGTGTAGSLHLVEPTRVYDSRWPGGMRHTGGGRGVFTNFGRNLTTGVVEGPQLVPLGARGLSFTVTATETIGGGFIAVTRLGAPTYKASCLNWTSSGQSIANTTMCELHEAQQPGLRIWNVGSTHVIIDVLGYYL
jgi:hypothetical protein